MIASRISVNNNDNYDICRGWFSSVCVRCWCKALSVNFAGRVDVRNGDATATATAMGRDCNEDLFGGRLRWRRRQRQRQRRVCQ